MKEDMPGLVKKKEYWLVRYDGYSNIYDNYNEAFMCAKKCALSYHSVIIYKGVEEVSLREDYTNSKVL